MKTYITISLLIITMVASNPTGAGRSDDKDEKKSVDEFQTGASEHSGYPQLFTRKTTRLLSEALHMLNRVKDVKERRWLEAFVHRLQSLSSELDSKATAKVSSNGTTKDLVAFSKSLAENTDQLKEFAVRGAMENDNTEDLNKEVSVGVAPKASEIYRDELESQLRSQPASEPRHHLKEALKTNKTPKLDDDQEREKSMALHRENKLKTEKMKEAEKKKILKEIYALSQKLKELGGETKSVLDVIKRSRGGVQSHHFWEGAHHQLKATTTHSKSVSGEDSVTSSPSNSQLREADNVPATKTTVSIMVPKEQRRSSGINSSSDEEEEEEENSEETSLDDNNDDLEKQLQEEKLILDSPQGTDDHDDQNDQNERKRRNHREGCAI